MIRRRKEGALIVALMLSACAGSVIPPSAGGPAPGRPTPSGEVATRPTPATPRPTLSVATPVEPGIDTSTAAGLGVTRGPAIADLIPSGEQARRALQAFRLSCPSLMRR
ncbi:MAG: hypothetical protein AB1431_20210, partial [Pseudomonadota bacterium]